MSKEARGCRDRVNDAVGKAVAGKASPANDTPHLSQRDKFIQGARELGCDESGEAFEQALDRILPPRKPGVPAPRVVDEWQTKGSRRKPKVG